MNKITIPDSFPNLPSSVKKIQKLFSSHEIDVPLLVNALKEEPLLSANILKLVNSPYYGLKGSVASIENGVALLGVTVVRGIIMATVLKNLFRWICLFMASLLKSLTKYASCEQDF